MFVFLIFRTVLVTDLFAFLLPLPGESLFHPAFCSQFFIKLFAFRFNLLIIGALVYRTDMATLGAYCSKCSYRFRCTCQTVPAIPLVLVTVNKPRRLPFALYANPASLGKLAVTM